MTHNTHGEPLVAPHATITMLDRLHFQGIYQLCGKRCLDLVLASLALVVAAPVMILVAIAVTLDGGAPIFGHERVGLHGRRFRCLKFRTMRRDSGAVLAAVLAGNPAAAEEWRRVRKLTDDPRVTPMGAWLRRVSLDELPQLFNVIRGDMSLVGPRPVTEGELDNYGRQLPRYLALRPGLTGLWQVHGRGDDSVDYGQRVAMDVRYHKTVSLPGDLWLMLQTAAVVFGRKGR